MNSTFPEGIPFSFRNLRIRFESNDIVSMEEQEKLVDNQVDFTDEEDSNQIEVSTLPPPTQQIPATHTPILTTALPQQRFTVKAWMSPYLNATEDEEPLEYPVNDEIPGLKELLQLAPLVVPHRLRHDHHRKKEEEEEDVESSSSIPSRFLDEHGLIDDEDYAGEVVESSTMEGMVGKVEEKGNATAKVIKVRGL
jgi:hypothetical protein